MIGSPRRVPLPVLDQAYYAGDRTLDVPDVVDAELAELVGYFMGDGSLHAKGIRLCVADTDLDVIERLRMLSKSLFGLDPVVTERQGYQEVTLQSVRLARWWQAAGFAKTLPHDDHSGKGWSPRVPSAILETNYCRGIHRIPSGPVRGRWIRHGRSAERVDARTGRSPTRYGPSCWRSVSPRRPEKP